MISDPVQQLLILCTNFQPTQDLRQQLLVASHKIMNWEKVPAAVEKQGMAPLAYFHLHALKEVVPVETISSLASLTLRHKLINAVRTRLLAEFVNSFQQAQIPFLTLKGAALAHLLYPTTDLRPMKDIDLLIRPQDVEKATRLLLKNGFQNKIGPNFHPSDLHLPTFTRKIEGFSISVEVHQRLLPDKNHLFWGYLDDLALPPQPFTLPSGEIAQTLSKAETLYHLCRHTFYSYHLLEPLNAIWVADIINFSEKFSPDIDWLFIKEKFPIVIHTLSALHEIRPLNEELIIKAGIPLRKKSAALVKPYQGWPGIPMRDVKKGERLIWAMNTCFPSGWVLFLLYGFDHEHSSGFQWVQHICQLLKLSWQHLKIRFRKKE